MFHVVTALMLNVKITGIYLPNGPVDLVVTSKFSYSIITISGSLGTIIISTLICVVSVKKETILGCMIGFTRLMGDFFYWGISPFIKHGDAYRMYSTNNIASSVIMGISVIFFVLFSISAILYIVNIAKIIDSKFY